MQLKDMITRRRSVRSYRKDRVGEELIRDIQVFLGGARRLCPQIGLEWAVMDTSGIGTVQKWDAPHVLAVFTEEKEGWQENLGFVVQQADLYMQSRGLGSCWVGLAWLKDESIIPKGMRLGILMPFGWPREVPERTGAEQFRRKALEEICDAADSRLEAARLAPSATNGQPWYFTHEGEAIHLWREEPGPIKRRTVGRYQAIDTGIALAHLYVENPQAFAFEKIDPAPEKEGYIYIGTVRL